MDTDISVTTDWVALECQSINIGQNGENYVLRTKIGAVTYKTLLIIRYFAKDGPSFKGEFVEEYYE